MHIISTSFSAINSIQDADQWLNRTRFYNGILETLARRHNVTSIEHIDFQGKIDKGGVKYVFIKERFQRMPVKTLGYIRKAYPDIILLNGFNHPLQILQLRIAAGSKPMIFVWNRAEKPFKGFKGWLQKIADRAVTRYFFSAKDEANKWLDSGIIKNDQKIMELNPGSSTFCRINKQEARQNLVLEEQTIFLWVGRLDANKDPVTVVNAFLEYCSNVAGPVLYFIFQEDELIGQLQSLIHSSPHGNRVILKGRIDHEELNNWYSAADFIISGSHSESNGLATLEAMSCGCIPILTRIPSFSRMTGNGSAGFLYEAGNQKDLLSVLHKITSVDIRAESNRVFEKYRDEFSFEAIAGRLNAIISNYEKR